jgi:hypothetical protein
VFEFERRATNVGSLGPNSFGTSQHAKTVSTLNEVIYKALYSNLYTTFQACTKNLLNIEGGVCKQPTLDFKSH